MIYPNNTTAERLWMREKVLEALDALEDRPEYRLPVGREAVSTLLALRARVLASVSSRPVVGPLADLDGAAPDWPDEAPADAPIDLSALLLGAVTRAAAGFSATWSYLGEVIEARDGWKERADRAEARLAELAAEGPSADPGEKA